MMILRDKMLDQAAARRVGLTVSNIEIILGIPVRALYHAGATNATLSGKCATFVS
jgi:hypothetical protein